MSQSDYILEPVPLSVDQTLDVSVGVRVMGFIQEPEEPLNINLNIMSELTGGDIINARSLYGYNRPFTGSDPTLGRAMFRYDTLNRLIRYDTLGNEFLIIPYNYDTDSVKLDVRSQINFICNEFELSEEEKNCCICMTDRNNEQICSLNCRHKFCVECIDILLKTKHTCPLCRTTITQIQTQTIEARELIHH